MLIAVIDGQGGGVGKSIIEALLPKLGAQHTSSLWERIPWQLQPCSKQAHI